MINRQAEERFIEGRKRLAGNKAREALSHFGTPSSPAPGLRPG